jgi:hypothetical protein
VDEAFEAWLNEVDYGGGCSTDVTTDPEVPEAPHHCGGDITVYWTYSSSCDADIVASATFTVDDAPLLDAWCPDPVDIPTYETQEYIDSEFADWLKGFGFIGGCNVVTPTMDYDPPDNCGGLVEIIYEVTDDCRQVASCSSYFTVSFEPDATVSCPPFELSEVDACLTQIEVDEAFEAWMDAVEIYSNCTPTLVVITDPEVPSAPHHCGGVTTVTWYVTDECNDPVSATCTFTVLPAPAIFLTPPPDLTLPECVTQEEINTAFAGWLDMLDYGGGCSPTLTPDPGTLVTPTFGDDPLTVQWTLTDLCGEINTTTTFDAPCNLECETAYAYLNVTNTTCFLDIEGLPANNWGWTTMIEEEGVYTMPLYAGAGQCIIDGLEPVGTVTVTYQGSDVTVQYGINEGYAMDQAHVYVGCEMLPRKSNGKFTTAPGQYTFVEEGLDLLAGATVTFTGVLPFIPDPGMPDYSYIYVIVHAETCSPVGDPADPVIFDPLEGPNCQAIRNPKDLVADDQQSDAIDVAIRPNPFFTSTDIDFSLPESEKAIVEVYNTLGEKITTLFQGTAEANHKYTVRFNVPGGNVSTMFLCVIRTEKGYAVKPMLIIK